MTVGVCFLCYYWPMTEYCYLNGEVILLDEAKVSVTDIGIERGYGIYDGLTAFRTEVFRFADHWNRFVEGAHALNLNIPMTEEKCHLVIKELLAKNGYERSIIRIVLTGGRTIAGIDYDFSKPTFYILVEKWEPLPREIYEKGTKLATYNFKREMPEFKTTNYIQAVNLQNWRREEKAIEILYVYDGEVLECATSNIFLVKGEKIITPAENMLKGITRKAVMEMRQVEERVVLESELKEADEVFITSSFKDIVPIVKIDDYEIGNGVVGKITKEIMAEFAKILNLS